MNEHTLRAFDDEIVELRGLISEMGGRAEAATTALLEQRGRTPEMVVANPVPFIFWQRTMLWRDSSAHGHGEFGLLDGVRLPERVTPNRLNDPALAASRGRTDVEAFLFWSRMPIVIERDGQTYLADQRFNSELTRGQFLVPLSSRP